jgi:hypothetical protein
VGERVWIDVALGDDWGRFGQPEVRLSVNEREWVTFLYRIRGYTPPESLFEGASVRI